MPKTAVTRPLSPGNKCNRKGERSFDLLTGISYVYFRQARFVQPTDGSVQLHRDA
ncbi:MULTISPECIES: hypothetical protein [Pseudomonas]|uniref:hypothetical protein n=1 Tax=Pseudomonas TaxID=286 RepID=UPI001F4CB05B|nr:MULTISPECIES: hypothetical protein [Pseudomonas]